MLALVLLITLTTPAAADVRGAPAAPAAAAERVVPAALGWRRPVAGAVARPFAYGADPFRAGWHRGVDFAVPPGSAVRAACSGSVATARPGLVTLRCGRWRVTHLPLASVSVVAGASVRAGRPLGAVGTSAEHTGLHLGVRRAGDRFAYVDPLPFLTARTTPPPVPAPRTTRMPRSGPPPASISDTSERSEAARASDSSHRATDRRVPQPGVVQLDTRGAAGRSAPATAPAAVPGRPRAPLRGAPRPEVRVSAPAGARGLAPWPAWAGLALLLLGVAGGGVRMRVRRRGAALSTAVPSVR